MGNQGSLVWVHFQKKSLSIVFLPGKRRKMVHKIFWKHTSRQTSRSIGACCSNWMVRFFKKEFGWSAWWITTNFVSNASVCRPLELKCPIHWITPLIIKKYSIKRVRRYSQAFAYTKWAVYKSITCYYFVKKSEVIILSS